MHGSTTLLKISVHVIADISGSSRGKEFAMLEWTYMSYFLIFRGFMSLETSYHVRIYITKWTRWFILCATKPMHIMSKFKSHLKETERELKSTYNVPSGAISVILVFYYCHNISKCPLKVSSHEQHLGCLRRNLPCVGRRFLRFYWMVAEIMTQKKCDLLAVLHTVPV